MFIDLMLEIDLFANEKEALRLTPAEAANRAAKYAVVKLLSCLYLCIALPENLFRQRGPTQTKMKHILSTVEQSSGKFFFFLHAALADHFNCSVVSVPLTDSLQDWHQVM